MKYFRGLAVERWFVSVAHAVEEAVQVVEPRAVLGLAAPALVHEVVQLTAAARRRRAWHAHISASAAPFTGVSYHLANKYT